MPKVKFEDVYKWSNCSTPQNRTDIRHKDLDKCCDEIKSLLKGRENERVSLSELRPSSGITGRRYENLGSIGQCEILFYATLLN